MRTIVSNLLGVVLLFAAQLASAANLAPGWALYPGQGIYSDDREYVLIMQADGNLVYYRTTDWAVRWHSGTHGRGGYAAPMQGDGNFVVYNSGWGALWNSGTQNHPGAYLAAQNDGNLVIYWNGQALWNIGVDPKTQKSEPRFKGDVVGRNMEHNRPYSHLGHIGFYDGANVVEVLNDGADNAVAYNSIANFKSRVPASGYWGAASPNIPDFYYNGCARADCTGNSYRIAQARQAMAERAYQILALGASYTHLVTYTKAQPRTEHGNSRRGMYRCDTFVFDVYDAHGSVMDASGRYIQVHPPALKRWFEFLYAAKHYGVVTPLNIFNKLKAFAG